MQIPPTSPFTKRGIAKLAWRATKFIALTGFNLARRGAQRGIERVQNRHKEDVKNETIDADYKMRGWRVGSTTPNADPKGKTEGLKWGAKK